MYNTGGPGMFSTDQGANKSYDSVEPSTQG